MGATLYNDVLGRLEWDGRRGCWQGHLDWAGGEVLDLSVAPGDEEEPAVYLSRAIEAVDWLRRAEKHARGRLAAMLLPEYNDNWSEEGPLTLEEFTECLVLLALDVPEDGAVVVWYDAGNLFNGQAIAATFDEGRTLRRADLVE